MRTIDVTVKSARRVRELVGIVWWSRCRGHLLVLQKVRDIAQGKGNAKSQLVVVGEGEKKRRTIELRLVVDGILMNEEEGVFHKVEGLLISIVSTYL